MTLVEKHPVVDADAISSLADEEHRLGRALESEMAWDHDLAAQLAARWPRVHSGTPGPLPLLEWDDAPAVVADCLRFWDALPDAVDEAIGGAWPEAADVDDATDARLTLLTLRCARDNERRAQWVAAVDHPRNPYGIALLRDRIEWVASGRQEYGTLAIGAGGPSRPRVPLDEPSSVDRRRNALGLPALSQDLATGVTEVDLIADVARRCDGP